MLTVDPDDFEVDADSIYLRVHHSGGGSILHPDDDHGDRDPRRIPIVHVTRIGDWGFRVVELDADEAGRELADRLAARDTFERLDADEVADLCARRPDYIYLRTTTEKIATRAAREHYSVEIVEDDNEPRTRNEQV